MKSIQQTAIVLFLILASFTVASAQTASCHFSDLIDFWEYSYTICAGNKTAEFRIDRTESIFNSAGSMTDSANAGMCKVINALQVYPPGVFGRDTVGMTIGPAADTSVVYATCEQELVHSRAAAVELVLDRSGSMGSGGKLQAAKTAAAAFLDTIEPSVVIRPGVSAVPQHYGIVQFSTTASFLQFPAGVPVTMQSSGGNATFIPSGAIDYVQPGTVTNPAAIAQIDHLTAFGSTSIGAGLSVARSGIEDNIPVDQEPYERPAILLLSDGMENTPPWISGQQQALIDRNIPVYSIGFGEDYDINANSLSELSAATGGIYRHTNDPDDLSKYFMEVLVDNYANTNIVVDPKGAIAGGQRVTHEFPVSSLEKKIIVVLTWRDPDNSLGLELVAPNMTISGNARPAGATIIDRNFGYKIYAVPVCQAAADTKCAKPGTWQLSISSPVGVKEHYSFTVLSNSEAAMAVTLPRVAGLDNKIQINAMLLAGGKTVEPASVKAVLTAPAENAFDRIARTKIDPSVLFKQGVRDGRATLAERKAFAVYKGKPVPRTTRDLQLKKTIDKQSGVVGYDAVVDGPLHPGSYTVMVQMDWKDQNGQILRRETTRSFTVSAKSSDKSRIDVSVLQEYKNRGTRQVRIDATPMDADGNLLGLGLEKRIELGDPNKSIFPSFVDLSDGRYRTEIEIPDSWQSLRLNMAGTIWEVKLPGTK